MNQARALYYMMKKSTPAKLKEAIISGDLSGCLVTGLNVLSREAQQEVITYGRKIAAVNSRHTHAELKGAIQAVTPKTQQEATQYRRRVELASAWLTSLEGLLPATASAAAAVVAVEDFVDTRIDFNNGRVHSVKLWDAYHTTPDTPRTKRTLFNKLLKIELRRRGYEATPSLLIGHAVTTGYKGVSLKGNKK